MEKKQKPKSSIILEWQPVGGNIDEAEHKLTGKFSISLPQLTQSEHLPDMLEKLCEQIGQKFKRIIYKQAIELADYELVMSRRAGKEGKGIRCSSQYTFNR